MYLTEIVLLFIILQKKVEIIYLFSLLGFECAWELEALGMIIVIEELKKSLAFFFFFIIKEVKIEGSVATPEGAARMMIRASRDECMSQIERCDEEGSAPVEVERPTGSKTRRTGGGAQKYTGFSSSPCLFSCPGQYFDSLQYRLRPRECKTLLFFSQLSHTKKKKKRPFSLPHSLSDLTTIKLSTK